MSTKIEINSSHFIPSTEIQRRRSAEKRRKSVRKATRQVLAASVAVAVVASGSVLSSRGNSNPERAKLRTALMEKSIPTTNPNVIVEPYVVGSTVEDTMLSEVAADLHPLTHGQDAMDEIQVLGSYLTSDQQEAGSFAPGQSLDIVIDTSKGKILPNSQDGDSVASHT